MDAYPSMFRCSSPSPPPPPYLSLMNMMNNNSGGMESGLLGMKMMSDGGVVEVPCSSEMMKSESICAAVATTANNNNGFTEIGAAKSPPPSAAAAGKKKGEKKMKKARFAFQTRSQVDILDDGYRWRKYGQKAVKNNRFPRSYYRCTHQGCNVKKQVQRLSKDEGVVVTTYEGIHSHPIEKSTDNFENILSQMQIYAAAF
ncbi:PREDICTED: probable WRKY transcription factor 75 isoform X2 [Ipomoea nil]|uniref:probable WRKY transcription factor 75 isoform X2 n=1 Tax=Ipomoea nil TaxID=35883 RepID=UPI000901E048|nr:PREDICTED: probable WRKY transcription factor 75 isoform X2 [Ipomoea nil]